jgi:hypothetical protein
MSENIKPCSGNPTKHECHISPEGCEVCDRYLKWVDLMCDDCYNSYIEGLEEDSEESYYDLQEKMELELIRDYNKTQKISEQLKARKKKVIL